MSNGIPGFLGYIIFAFCSNFNGCCPNTQWDSAMDMCVDCPNGYVWINCSKPCQYPYYGINCIRTCFCKKDNCDNVQWCHRLKPNNVSMYDILNHTHEHLECRRCIEKSTTHSLIITNCVAVLCSVSLLISAICQYPDCKSKVQDMYASICQTASNSLFKRVVKVWSWVTTFSFL